MQAVQPVSGTGDVTTNGFRVNDAVVYLIIRATPRSLYVGIKSGIVLEFDGSRARIRHRKGRPTWVDARRLRPLSARTAMEQIFMKNMI
jgi:hypothetical protein